MNEDDHIPVVEIYRGIGVEDSQPAERVALVVRPAIDRVHAMSDVDLLISYAGDSNNPPEARQFASAKVEVEWEVAAAERRSLRPGFSLERLRALTAGLGCKRWRDPDRHCSLLDAHPERAVPREQPLDDEE